MHLRFKKKLKSNVLHKFESITLKKKNGSDSYEMNDTKELDKND